MEASFYPPRYLFNGNNYDDNFAYPCDKKCEIEL